MVCTRGYDFAGAIFYPHMMGMTTALGELKKDSSCANIIREASFSCLHSYHIYSVICGEKEDGISIDNFLFAARPTQRTSTPRALHNARCRGVLENTRAHVLQFLLAHTVPDLRVNPGRNILHAESLDSLESII